MVGVPEVPKTFNSNLRRGGKFLSLAMPAAPGRPRILFHDELVSTRRNMMLTVTNNNKQ